MTDRELLEAAAKAAGYEYVWDWPRGAKQPTCLRIKEDDRNVAWHPFSNDGDALRLAVKKSLLTTDYGLFLAYYSDEIKNDKRPSEATRRAIVRAAASIGRLRAIETINWQSIHSADIVHTSTAKRRNEMSKTIAQAALTDIALRDKAVDVHFFTRSTIYNFADGSRLTVNMYGPSYAA